MALLFCNLSCGFPRTENFTLEFPVYNRRREFAFTPFDSPSSRSASVASHALRRYHWHGRVAPVQVPCEPTLPLRLAPGIVYRPQMRKSPALRKRLERAPEVSATHATACAASSQVQHEKFAAEQHDFQKSLRVLNALGCRIPENLTRQHLEMTTADNRRQLLRTNAHKDGNTWQPRRGL